MRTNPKASDVYTKTLEEAPKTGGGGFGRIPSAPIDALRRQVGVCMLWEDAFYTPGLKVADQIKENALKAEPEEVAALAEELRTMGKLRHVPLYLTAILARHPKIRPGIIRRAVRGVVRRADEMGELLAIFCKLNDIPLDKVRGIPMGLKRGLADSFDRFDRYQISKYANRDSAIKVRDVLFLVHPKPKDQEHARLWKDLADGKLTAPDTWEANLSAGEDKKATFERLMVEKKLGGDALLKNLRLMQENGVTVEQIREAIIANRFRTSLPFRFIQAAKMAPAFETELDAAMIRTLDGMTKIPGHTVLVIDVSGSMYNAPISKLTGRGKGDRSEATVTRMEAAISLAILIRGVCESVEVWCTAGNDHVRRHATVMLPARQGMALGDAIRQAASKLGGGGIFLTQAMEHIRENTTRPVVDRVICIGDEQDCENDPQKAPLRAPLLAPIVPMTKNYVMNVGADPVGFGIKEDRWCSISGFSQHVVDYVAWREGIE